MVETNQEFFMKKLQENRVALSSKSRILSDQIRIRGQIPKI